MNSSPIDRSEVVSKSADTELWVEKYKPMSYVDLLSDEVPMYDFHVAHGSMPS